MRIPRTTRSKSTDWVLQFINIVFLLLLYFLVNGSIVEMQQKGIELPVSLGSAEGLPPRDGIYIDRDGALFFRRKSATAEDIAKALGFGLHPYQAVVIADRQLPATRLITIVTKLREQGLARLQLVTLNQVKSP